MNKNNTKSRNKRPECDAHTPLPLSKYQQYGRSMIEMLGVLAIIGVLSVGGIMGYSKAMFRYKINKTIEQIAYIAGNVRTAFASQGNYEGLDWDVLWKKAHLFPDDMWKDPFTLNLWGGQVILDRTAKNSADNSYNKAFYIEYYDVPQEACIELITHDWKNAQVNMIDTNDYRFISPAKLDDAIKICDSENLNVMMFNFDIDTSDSLWKDQIDATTARLGGS